MEIIFQNIRNEAKENKNLELLTAVEEIEEYFNDEVNSLINQAGWQNFDNYDQLFGDTDSDGSRADIGDNVVSKLMDAGMNYDRAYDVGQAAKNEIEKALETVDAKSFFQIVE